jgi:sugar phosphate isomerase/epimerase/protein-tyrosine-phosphatase
LARKVLSTMAIHPPSRASQPPRILFICTGNAGRSQIAHAFCRRDYPTVHAQSAGVEPWNHLHPMAVKLMAERGISLNDHYPKPVSAVADRIFDLVVTIGEPARLKTPIDLPGEPLYLHWDLADPADADGTADSEPTFRRAAAFIEKALPKALDQLRQLVTPARCSLRPGIGTGIVDPAPFIPATHLPAFVDAGFAAIELNLFCGRQHFDPTVPHALAELRTIAEDRGLDIWSVHEAVSAQGDKLGSSDAAARERAADSLRQAIDCAAELNAKVVVTHALIPDWIPEDIPADPTSWSRYALDALHTLTPIARDAGIRIGLENGYLDKPGIAARDVLHAVHQLPADAFGFVLDSGHAHVAGDVDLIHRTVADRLISIHLHDNDSTTDHHLAPGEGSLDWPGLFNWLSNQNYDGCVMYEVMSLYRDNTDPLDALAATMRGHRNCAASFPRSRFKAH